MVTLLETNKDFTPENYGWKIKTHIFLGHHLGLFSGANIFFQESCQVETKGTWKVAKKPLIFDLWMTA